MRDRRAACSGTACPAGSEPRPALPVGAFVGLAPPASRLAPAMACHSRRAMRDRRANALTATLPAGREAPPAFRPARACSPAFPGWRPQSLSLSWPRIEAARLSGDCRRPHARAGDRRLDRSGRYDLTARIFDGDRVCRVVDDYRVVDVIVDDVSRGRHHIRGRIDPNRDGNKYWERKHEKSNRRRRRQEEERGEINRRRRQEDDWRRRHEAERRIVEDKHRAIDIDDLRGRRRRHVVRDRRVRRRRFLGGC